MSLVLISGPGRCFDPIAQVLLVRDRSPFGSAQVDPVEQEGERPVRLGPERDLGPDLPALIRRRDRHEAMRAQLTVFDSTGWSLEDLIAAELVLDHGERLGEGFVLNLQPAPQDPYDPYEFLCE